MHSDCLYEQNHVFSGAHELPFFFFNGSIILLTITLGKQYLQYKYDYLTNSIYIILR